MAIDGSSPDVTLQVDGFGMSIGSVSVGLPAACTSDTVLSRYIDLVRLTGHEPGGSGPVAPRDDVIVLAAATKLDASTVQRRLERLAD